MSTFSSEWLAVREPVDHRSRSHRITQAAREWALARWSRSGRPLAIVDLGAGAGSNCRYLAEHLPVPQTWRLIDGNAGLLAEAAGRLERGLPATVLGVSISELDLAATAPADLVADADLVTASSLFDLVAEPWLRDLLRVLPRPGHALLATLMYDGRMRWAMADAADSLINRLLNQHQLTDKGFGPALGPNAATVLDELIKETEGRALTAESDWIVGPDDASLQSMLLPTWAGAAKIIAPAQTAVIEQWLDRRAAAISTIGSLLVVGHRDTFAHW
jgi:SAM-dependent methyltransferase